MLTNDEEKILSDIDKERMWGHVKYLSTIDKTSGTEGERRAHQYVREKLGESGISCKTYEFDSLISHPKEAFLSAVFPSVLEIECITHSFSASTPEEGIEAELVYVPSSPSDLFTPAEGLAEEYRRIGVEGKIAIVRGVASPAAVCAAEQAGALAQVHINGGDVLHEMIVSTIWGTPTPESADRVPRLTAVSVKKTDGEKLLGLLEKGPLRVRVRAKSDTRWRRLPLTVAEIRGQVEPERFMLIHGHMDSWYVGTTDNCTGNALILELARLLQSHRSSLNRSVRIAWWAGHSTGRYSGSTWYADNLFEELDKHCFLSLNIDSPGVKGATEIAGGGLMGTMEFIRQALMDAIDSRDVKANPFVARAGDLSFYGVGIPSIAMMAYIPEGDPLRGRWIGGSGGGWFWHSAHDTLDKADKDILLRDLRMYTLAILRSVNREILPFNLSEVADQFQDAVTDIQTHTTSGTFNMNSTLDRIRELKTHSEELNRTVGDLRDSEKRYEVNQLLMEVSRILISTFYTYAGRYDHDPAYGIPSLPALQGARKLAELDPQGDEARFLLTKMTRERNKVNHQLGEAVRKVKQAINLIKS